MGVPTTDTTVTITIFDSLGASVTASLILDIAPVLPLSVIPSSQTLSNPAIGDTAQYQIMGGTGGYAAFSNSPALATAVIVGNIMTATVHQGPSADTTVAFTIYDSAGSSTTASLVLDVVPTVALNMLPAAVTLTGVAGAEDSVTFYITGGSGSYPTVTSSNTAIIPTPAIAGNQFTINPAVVSASTTVTLTVADSLGATDTSTVTVTPATSAMAINPSSIAVDLAVGTVTYNIIGGLPPFDVFTSNSSIATVGWWSEDR